MIILHRRLVLHLPTGIVYYITGIPKNLKIVLVGIIQKWRNNLDLKHGDMFFFKQGEECAAAWLTGVSHNIPLTLLWNTTTNQHTLSSWSSITTQSTSITTLFNFNLCLLNSNPLQFPPPLHSPRRSFLLPRTANYSVILGRLYFYILLYTFYSNTL